jgi:hypothetical protein
VVVDVVNKQASPSALSGWFSNVGVECSAKSSPSAMRPIPRGLTPFSTGCQRQKRAKGRQTETLPASKCPITRRSRRPSKKGERLERLDLLLFGQCDVFVDNHRQARFGRGFSAGRCKAERRMNMRVSCANWKGIYRRSGRAGVLNISISRISIACVRANREAAMAPMQRHP